jgi:lipopolysaccharide-induced tumor necrosis factor-alpha factor
MSQNIPQYRCPYCATNRPPYTMTKISSGGWVVFALMLLFCFPLFWIGLLMKDEHQYCSQCRVRLN